MAAAAAYAGIQVRGSLREMEERLAPWSTAAAIEQERALDAAAAEMFPRILSEGDRRTVADETLDLAARLMRRIADAPKPRRGRTRRGSGTLPLGTDALDELDDGLIAHDEAAAVILGLQDRVTRDWAAEWMEEPEAGPALRLWRALARRCVGPYGDHAAALLTLAGWVSWSTGDEPHARVAFGLALRADPDYRFANLLHEACNQGLDPEELRICLREERAARLAGPAEPEPGLSPAKPDPSPPEAGLSPAEPDPSPPEAGSSPAGPDPSLAGPALSAADLDPDPDPTAGRPVRPGSRGSTGQPAAKRVNRQRGKGSSAPGGAVRPEPPGPGSARRGSARPEPVRPGSARPESVQPEPAQPESAHPESVRPGSAGGESVGEESVRGEGPWGPGGS